MADTRVDILITATNDAKKVLDSVMKDLAGVSAALSGLGTSKTNLGQTNRDLREVGSSSTAANTAIASLTSGVKLLAGGFLALKSVQFIKDLADAAARTEVLGTVLHSVGGNAGYTKAELDKVDSSVQKLGITASSSRQSLTQFLQAGLKLEDAPKLARAAQDLAVIAGENSSATFNRLITNIQQMDVMGLRFMGIIVDRDHSEQEYAISLGKTSAQLTTMERRQAFMNATLKEAIKLEGTYLAAMGDVGKQITSLDRLTDGLKVSLGNNLLPAYLAIVEELSLFLENSKLASDSMTAQGQGARTLGDNVKIVARVVRELAETIIFLKDQLIAVGIGFAVFRYVVPMVLGLGAAFTLFTAAVTGAIEAIVVGRTVMLAIGGTATVIALPFSTIIGLVAALAAGLIYLYTQTTGGGAAWVKFANGAMDAFDSAYAAWLRFRKSLQGNSEVGEASAKVLQNKIDAIEKGRTDRALAPGAPANVSALIQATRALAIANEEATDAVTAYNKVSANGSLEQIAAAKLAMDAAKKRKSDMADEFDLAVKKAKAEKVLDVEKKVAIEQGVIAQVIATKKEKDDLASLLEARKNLKADDRDFGGGKIRSSPYVSAQSEVNDELERVEKLKAAWEELNRNTNAYDIAGIAKLKSSTEEASGAVEQLGYSFEKLAALAHTKGDLKELDDVLRGIKESAAVSQKVKDEAAKRNVEAKFRQAQEEKAIGAQLRAEVDAQAEARLARIAQDHQSEADINKAAGTAALAHMATLLELGVVTQGAYDARKLGVIKGANKDEQKVLDANLALLYYKRKHALDESKRIELDTQIEMAKDKKKATDAATKAQIEAEADAQAKMDEARAKSDRASLNSSKDNSTGGYEGALAQASEKYAQMDKDRIAGKIKLTEAQVEEQRIMEMSKIILDGETAAINRASAALNRQLDLLEAKIIAQKTLGNITGLEADAALGGISERRAEAMRKELDAKKELRDVAKTSGQKAKDSLEADISGVEVTLTKTEARVAEASQQLGDSMKTGISSGLKGVIQGTMTWGQAITGVISSVAGAMLDIWAKTMAEMIMETALMKAVTGSMKAGITAIFGFADGGYVAGSGTGTSDSINAKLSNGEYVMTADKTAQYLPVLELMRQGLFGDWMNGLSVSMAGPRIPLMPHFAQGGLAKSGGGGGDTYKIEVNVDASGTSVSGDSSKGADLGKVISVAVKAEIANQQRNGGLLAK